MQRSSVRASGHSIHLHLALGHAARNVPRQRDHSPITLSEEFLGTLLDRHICQLCHPRFLVRGKFEHGLSRAAARMHSQSVADDS